MKMKMVKLYEIDWKFKDLKEDNPVNTSLMAGHSKREVVQDMFMTIIMPIIITDIREVIQ